MFSPANALFANRPSSVVGGKCWFSFVVFCFFLIPFLGNILEAWMTNFAVDQNRLVLTSFDGPDGSPHRLLDFEA